MPISGFQFIFAKRERKILGTEFSAFDEIVETAPCRVVSTLIYSIIKAEKFANMCEGDKNCFKTYEFGIFLKLESKKIYEARKCNFLSPTLFSIYAFFIGNNYFSPTFWKAKKCQFDLVLLLHFWHDKVSLPFTLYLSILSAYTDFRYTFSVKSQHS